MSFKELDLKSEYRTSNNNIAREFLIPVLSEAKIYKRAVGYFSSTSLVEISKGISKLVENGGKIQIVASPALSEEDITAIEKGYDDRNKIIQNALLRELKNHNDYFEVERLNLLANLIADGILDIKIALLEKNNNIGIYHEKMGILEDSDGNIVAFSGSLNESENALINNYETIDVFRNWKGTSESERVNNKVYAFTNIWNNAEETIEVLDFPEVSEEIIKKYKRSKPNFGIDEEEFPQINKDENKEVGPRIPDFLELYDYQNEAIDSWLDKNAVGIFNMATGTGKTFTGLSAITKLAENLDNKLAVFIVCPFQHLVEQWVEDIEKFNIKPIIGYGSSPQKNWKELLVKAIRQQRRNPKKSFFCFVCTNKTFSSEFVQNQINRIKSSILLVIDEAHNFGSENYSKLLNDRFKYRLALSATFERFGDEIGTKALYNFFGDICIDYNLDRAIKENKLTKYNYFPIVVNLNREELDRYNYLSTLIKKSLVTDKRGKIKLSKYGEIQAIKRARIVAAASEKLNKLKEYIQPYKKDNYILVYCGATSVAPNGDFISEIDTDEIKQVDAVTQLLGLDLNMKVARFTSKENIKERESIKEHFSNGKDLQALVAIKCLDEGVNIPATKTAFILASTTNPKEYIQRRGRVLRKSPQTGKEIAEIYDFITLPRPIDEVSYLPKEDRENDLSLVKKELRRLWEFGRLANNKFESINLINQLCDKYEININEIKELRSGKDESE